MKRNFIVKGVELGVGNGYRELVCDACNKVFIQEKNKKSYKVNAVFLNGVLWGIVCDESSKLLEEQVKNVYNYNSCDIERPEVIQAIKTLKNLFYLFPVDNNIETKEKSTIPTEDDIIGEVVDDTRQKAENYIKSLKTFKEYVEQYKTSISFNSLVEVVEKYLNIRKELQNLYFRMHGYIEADIRVEIEDILKH